MTLKNEDANFNVKDIDTARIMNKVESKINLIKSNTGYGNILINIYDKKVTNIKATISEDVK